ncbi:MAG: hypothetical protein AAGF20_04935 [Pseudomonadota bacterium]
MSVRTRLALGFLIFIVGVVKALDHSQAVGTLTVTTCLGEPLTLEVGASLWHRVHCWGCYVALAGLALMGMAGWRGLRARGEITDGHLDALAVQ